jgi:multicomponent K+:H+ antiporter subunit D
MIEWLHGWMPHLVIAPILLPLATAALLLASEPSRTARALLSVGSTVLGVLLAVAILLWVDGHSEAAAFAVYLPGNWPVPFGIVLVADRLSAMMLVLTSLVGLSALLFALARWDRAGVHFHPLFQIQLMGLNGAFLTADLFNLFVFFEVLLVASYGLLLHGSGRARVQSGLHYIAINLLASLFFLVGVATIYGITGTLNMADLSQKVALVADGDRALLHVGVAIFAIALLTKAAMWPLCFWLVPAYSAASAPAAALFAVMTKLGVYTVLRLWTLLFSAPAGASAQFGAEVLVFGGLATLAFGAIGVLASHHLGRQASFCVIVSSGTLMAAIGFGQAAITGGALYYLLSSTLAASALFLLFELIERSRMTPIPVFDDDADPLPFYIDQPGLERSTNLDEDEEELIGKVIPAAMAFLGFGFVLCALLLAGLPPLAGFIGKFAMLSALLDPLGLGQPPIDAGPSGVALTLMAFLIISSLLSLIALSNTGIRYFWAPHDRQIPRLRIIECAPVAALLVVCVGLTILAEPAIRYTRAAADSLHQPTQYINAVMFTSPVPGPTTGAGAVDEGTGR